VLGSPDHFVACHFPLIEAAEVPVGNPTSASASPANANGGSANASS
jgi:hypothetical protein